ncbi:MAG: hypothetical protein KQH83_10100 [Actinobacteria bacterium]|nr:hypothetical protein [Actinomycetota bacterium]
MNGRHCANGHPMPPGDRFCRTCGAPPGASPPPAVRAGGKTGSAWLWFLLGIVAVAAAAAVIVLVTRDDGGAAATPSSSTTQAPAAGSSPTSTTTSAATTPPSTTATAVATTTTLPGPATVQNGSWEPITGGPLAGPGGQEMYDIVATAGGYLAVGLDGSTAIWTSPDAITWTRQAADPVLDGTEMTHLETAPDGTLVGVGRLSDTRVFAAWTSPDGVRWTRQPPATGDLPSGAQQIHGFTSHPGGYLAVGSVDNAGDADAAWWTSPDGITWTAGTIAEPGLQQMLGVAVADGIAVATGEARPDTGIWRAPAGEAFTRVHDPDLTIAVSDFDPSNTDARVFAWDIAATGPGFVAVGADQTTAGMSMAAAWTSADGHEWLRFGNETEATPNMAGANFWGNGPWTVMDTVLDSDGTAIAIGRTGTPGDPDLAVWESADGFTWTEGPVAVLPTPQRARRAIAIDDAIIAVGADGALDGTGDAAVWILTGAAEATGCPMDWTAQSGTATSIGDGTVSVPITPVDRSTSFLVFSTRHDLNRPVTTLRGAIAADGASVEFTRATDEASPVDIAWYVVTYPCGVKVQHGDVVSGPLTTDVAIEPISATDQAFVLWSKSVEPFDQVWSDDDPTIAELTSTTNLQIRHSGIETAHVVSWQVVEFTDPAAISVQRGTTSIMGTDLAATVTLPEAVDPARAFPLVSFRMNDGTMYDASAHMIGARLTGPETLVIERSTAGTNDITEILWEVVELGDGSTVRHDTETLADGAAGAMLTVSPFVADRAYAFATVQGSNGLSLGRTDHIADATTGVASFTIELSMPRRLILTRANASGEARVGWVVVTRD